MFDLRADNGTVRKKKGHDPIKDAPPPETAAQVVAKLDKPEMEQLHKRLLDYYARELDRQYDNRIEMAQDADFYDNIQWDEADAQQLRDRGQMPLVYNVISASVDWVTGTEKRARSEYKILPRRKEDGKPAERKSQLMKYLEDVNRTPFSISRAFTDAVKVGLGWIEDGIQDEDEEEPLYTKYESWRNVLHDSAATELDLSDARYILRSKWLDLDVAEALFPKRKAILNSSAADSDEYINLDQYGDEAMDAQEAHLDQRGQSASSDRLMGYQRRRVRVIEAWIRQPVEVEKVRGGTWRGEIFDPQSPAHAEEVRGGRAETVKKTVMRVHVAIFCTAGMLWFSESPYRHNRFPFTPIWGYRRDRDGMPYGMIRRLKDIQTDINKRASKALHILSTNKTIMDEGAVEDVDEFIEEVSRPDAVIVKKPGKELDINVERELAPAHLDLMSRSIAMVQQASGVTDELMGRRTNATSGIAIQRRQDQGSMQTATFFDNLFFASQVRGEKLLANIEQFVSDEKAFRITNMRGKPEYIKVNDGLPENDIIRSKADFIISESAWHASLRQAAVEELLDLVSKLAPVAPQAVIVMLDLIVESMDIQNREELVKRIRSVTGQRDPDAEEPTQEEVAQEQAKAAAAQMQAEAQQATIDKLKAEAAEKLARAEEIQARMANTNVDSQQKALQAAQTAITVPATTTVADHILHEAGLVSRGEKEQVVQAAQKQAAMLAQQPGLTGPQQSGPAAPPQPGPPQQQPTPAPM